MTRSAGKTHRISKEAVLERLDIAREYAKLGVEFTSDAPNAKGWRECHAIGREDNKPSAAVNVKTGQYKDFGNGGNSLSFWDFAVAHGGMTDFRAALTHFAEASGLTHPPDASEPSEGSKRRKKAQSRAVFRTFEAAVQHAAQSLEGGPGALAASWIYYDEVGQECFRVARFALPNDRKTYRPIWFDPGADGWVFGDPPEPLPLYRLTELDGDSRVWVFEGEKVADMAVNLGLIATTSAHGAQAAHKASWAPLASREVIIVPDNDQAGENYASAVLDALAKLSPRPTVRVLRLPGLPKKGDLEEWLEALPDSVDDASARARLEQFADACPFWNFDHVALPSDDELGIIDLSAVEPMEVEWLWWNRIPAGKITLLAGEGGLGKSYMTMSLAAIVSRGAVWPDDPETSVRAGDVIVLNAEDELADTVVPRLRNMGADMMRVISLGTGKGPGGKPLPFTLSQIDRLEKIVAKRPTVRLIIIDPIPSYLGRGIDDAKNAELRTILTPLAEFAARHKIAILAITHFNKSVGTRAVNKVMGSVAYTNVARAAWCVLEDPEDPTRRLLLPYKNNLSPDRTGMAFTICDDGVVWEQDPVTTTIGEVLGAEAAKAREPKREKCIAWVRQLLSGGPLPSNDIITRARAAGFGKDLVWDVKDKAGVKARKGGMKGGWLWELEPEPTTSETNGFHAPGDQPY